MNSNTLTLLGTTSRETLLSVVPCLLSLTKAYDKKNVVLSSNDDTTKALEADLKGKASVQKTSAANLMSDFAALQNGDNFILYVGTGDASRDELGTYAEQASAIASPLLLLLDAGNGSFDAVEKLLSDTLPLFAPRGAYLLGTVLLGASLTRAQQDELNVRFSKKGESPIYFLKDKTVSAESFADAVNTDLLASRLCGPQIMAPSLFELELTLKAQKAHQKIVLAEGEEERILRATEILLQRRVADIILLGDTAAIQKKAGELGLDIQGAELIDPASSPKFSDYADTYYELRKNKGVTPEDAQKTMRDPTVFGTMMVKKGDADGMVSGAINTTAHTIRPALQFVKTKPGFSVVSSCFLMCLADRVLVFGDCAVNPNPTAEQLAEIAITTAQTAMAFGIEPRVAMISYSSGNSGKGPDVDLVIEATKLAKEKDPSLVIDGPLQYDAAIDPTVAKTKMPQSPVAGKATVFIFPSLTTGNTTYKAVQRACDAIAIGPVLQGLNKPVNDLSRGCLVPDIVNTVAITAIQAYAEK